MALRDQKDPVVVIWKEKGKSQWVVGVKDDKVMCNLDDGTTGHKSCDNTCTWIEVTQLGRVCGQGKIILEGTQLKSGNR